MPDPLSFSAGFLQFDVQLGDPAANLARVEAGLDRLQPQSPGILLLPELWATGFAYQNLPELARQVPDVLLRVQKLAAQYQVLIAGSLPEPLTGSDLPCNTLFVTSAWGSKPVYRKQHLFAPIGEDRHLQPGDNPQPFDTKLGRMAGLICFDLRFPELVRCQAGLDARLLLVCAQWPQVRLDHWRTLVAARAIENQLFVVAANRCGADAVADGITYAGHSLILAPDGAILHEAGEGEEEAQVRIDITAIDTVRARFNTAAPAPYARQDSGKIMHLDTLLTTVAQLKQLGRQVVFTNGCFDILHSGHVSYLEAARRQGDCLIVGLNSDASVRSIKGPQRPVNCETDRARVLAALGCVDYVVLFSDDTPLALITAIMPDVLVKAADWAEENIVGAREVKAAGGWVARIPLVAGASTTGLLEKIRKNHKPEEAAALPCCTICGIQPQPADPPLASHRGSWLCPACLAEEESCGCGD